MRIKTKNKQPYGFSLIEILLVISIIGLLATIMVVALNSAREQARDSRRLADITTIQRALELYRMAQGSYPIEAVAVTLGLTNYKCLNSSGWQTVGCSNAYIDHIPADQNPGGTGYTYTGSASTFLINFQLEHGSAKFPAGPCRGLPVGVINCP